MIGARNRPAGVFLHSSFLGLSVDLRRPGMVVSMPGYSFASPAVPVSPGYRASALRAGCLLLAIVGATSFALTYLVAVRTSVGQVFDTRAMLEVSSALAGQTWTATVLALISPLSVVVAVMSIAGVAALWRGRRAAVRVLATTGGTIAGAALLKTVLARPEFLDGAGNSLPSGHVAAVAALAVAITLAVPAIHRGWVAILGFAATGITGLATLALQWHRPSDVMAAMLLAITVGGLSTAATSS